jgi:hypothetical protein
MSARGKNAQPNTHQIWAGDRWVASYAGVVNYYVDDISGLDTNPGTVGAPFKTITKVFGILRADGAKVRANTIVYISPHSAASGYAMTGIQSISSAGGDLTFKGVGSTQLLAPVTLATIPTSFQLNFPAASFTSQAHRGLHLECVTATVAANVGVKRTITRNSATDVWLGHSYSSAVTVGDTFRVVEPSVVLQLDSMSPVVGGASDFTNVNFSPGVNFVNVIIRSPTTTLGPVTLTGVVRFFGVVVRGLYAGIGVFGEAARIWAGRRINSATSWSFLTAAESNGWGLSILREATTPVGDGADLELYSSRFHGVIVANRLTHRFGGRTNITGGAFAATASGSGALRCFASDIQLGEAGPSIFLDAIEAPTAAVMAVSERGNLSVNTATVEQLTGSGTVSAYCTDSRMIFNGAGNQPILLGQVSANGNGALVSLEGVSGSSVAGGFVVGSLGPGLTQATFAVGDSLNVLGSQVYRPI